MHKHYSNGPEIVQQAQARRKQKALSDERMKNAMVWMAYLLLVSWGIFLHAAGWM